MARHIVIDCDSRTLAFFDPGALEGRRGADPKWMRDRAAVGAEAAAGNLATVPLDGPRASFSVEVVEPPPASPPAGTLHVPSGTVYFGDVSELPSTRWGRRRWNAWDWLFMLFILSLVPFGLWFAGFDPRLLEMLLVIGTLTVIASALIALVVFRSGREFARRSGTPPVDRPHQTLTLPSGDYRYWVEPSQHGMAIRVARLPSP